MKNRIAYLTCALILTLASSPVMQAQEDFTPGETAILKRLDKSITENFNSVLQAEIKGSLKKSEVGILNNKLNSLTDYAYNIAKTRTLTPKDEARIQKDILKVSLQRNNWINNNLAYCRRKGGCS